MRICACSVDVGRILEMSMITSLESRSQSSAALAVGLAAFLFACGGSEEGSSVPLPSSDALATASAADVPGRVELPEIARSLRGPVDNEALSESLDAWLGTFGNKLRIRDFDGIRDAFVEEFEGERLFPESLGGGDSHPMPLDVKRFTAPDPTEGLSRDACLLYTSPSPRDRTRSRMPSSA